MKQFILGDCMDYLKDFPDNYFDLAIVDPPYGIKRLENQKGRLEKYGDTRKANNDRPARTFDFPYFGNIGCNDNRIHPTQKPVELYKWILHNYAEEGYKILDTHVGSASSLIACEDMGFDYVGYEIDEGFYNLARKRIDEFNAQVRWQI